MRYIGSNVVAAGGSAGATPAGRRFHLHCPEATSAYREVDLQFHPVVLEHEVVCVRI